MQQQQDSYFIPSPGDYQPGYPPPKQEKKFSIPWGLILGLMLGVIPQLLRLQPQPKVDDSNQCRQVNLSKTKIKYLVVNDWLTGQPMYRLPHGSKVTVKEERVHRDSHHKTLLLSEYNIFNHGKVRGYGIISSGYTDKDGRPHPLFTLCR